MSVGKPHTRRPSLLFRPGCWVTGLTLIPLLVGGLYVMENWFGARQLKRAKARVAAAGIELDLHRLPPSRPPDEENFCATPLLRTIGEGRRDDPLVVSAVRLADTLRSARETGVALQSVNSPGETDWMAFHEAIRATDAAAGQSERLREGEADPMHALWELTESEMTPVTSELMTVIDRPKAVMIPTYLDSMAADPALMEPSWAAGSILRLSQAYQWRATLAQARGDGAAFVESCRIILRLAEAMEVEAPIFGAMLGLGTRASCRHAIWTAAANRRLTGETYRELAKLLHGIPRPDALPAAIEKELQFGHATLESRRYERTFIVALALDQHFFEPWQEVLIGLMPQGWFEASHAANLELMLALLQRVQDPSIRDRFNTTAWIEAEISKAKVFPFHSIAAAVGLKTFHSSIRHFASSHAVTRMAEATCALEAYFADHQVYPDSLDALVPGFLPVVPVDLDGKPLRYARDPGNGRYMLWSIGLDGVDDGGVEKAEGGGKPKVWSEPVGDWVWRYPP